MVRGAALKPNGVMHQWEVNLLLFYWRVGFYFGKCTESFERAAFEYCVINPPFFCWVEEGVWGIFCAAAMHPNPIGIRESEKRKRRR